MSMEIRRFVAAGIAAIALSLPVASSFAAVTWPAGQQLPSFSTPASTQDLYTQTVSTPRWDAEGSSISHSTGHLDGDGWLCQTGVDAAAKYMVYGPYDSSLPSGPNVAQFRVKVDNNTANNDNIVTIDVRNNTSGAVLASSTITRQQFSIAGDYVTFSLPFNIPADNQSLEFRVYWFGTSYTKVDWVGVTRSKSADEAVLFSSLKGVVNATQPRIYSYEGGDEGKYTWLNSLGLGYTEPADKWTLITKYRSTLQGLVVYDDAQPDTINLATTIAGGRKALVTSASLLPKLTVAPYSLPILVDLRGQYGSKLAVYQALYNTYWPSVTHRVLVGLDPNGHKAAAREYATALGAAVVWLDPRVAAESTLLNSFLNSMGAGATYMGWWPEEQSGVTAASQYGIATVASDWSTNLTVHSGMSRTVNVKATPAKPALQNKMYVAFIYSDGDNLQFVEHLMRKRWDDPARGQVPIGWTVSPAMLDAMPGALNYYYNSGTANDNLISGPSGYGYAYPNNMTQAQLDKFVTLTEDYARRAGLRVVTIWNTITGGINANVGNTFASRAPSLLGLTGQNTGGGLTIYGSGTARIPGFALSCNYCTTEQAMKDHIASAASGWNGTSPRFILVQAQPWQGITPTSFLNVKNSLNANYVVVRPDNWFQLLREANGLPVNPGVSPNLALNKAATGSAACNADEGPEKAVNGTTSGGNNDKWCSAVAGIKFLQVDLGSNVSVGKLVVKHANAGGESVTYNTRDFTLQVGTNGTSWTTVATVTANTAGTTTHTFAATSVRYIRLNITNPVQATDGSGAARIYEFEAYAN